MSNAANSAPTSVIKSCWEVLTTVHRRYSTSAVEVTPFHRVWISIVTICLVALPGFSRAQQSIETQVNTVAALSFGPWVPWFVLAILVLFGVMINAPKRHGSVLECIQSAAGLPGTLYAVGLGATLFTAGS